jgi:cytochrome c oxidase assembly protein subunit 15
MPFSLGPKAPQKSVSTWLFVLVSMVVVMVVIGGVTRLTESGLSIVEWRPVTGWLPPLDEAEWLKAFESYKRFPEYQHVNAGMSLADYKSIFWLEYLHRLWGRLIGLAYVVPLAVFAWRGYIDRSLGLKLGAIFTLGALQGVLGWYMVKSGLVDQPDVSQYRLVSHLGLALVIIAALFWLALDLRRGQRQSVEVSGTISRGTLSLSVLVLLTILSGGFVAGLNAGLVYNTFPLMGETLVPSDYWDPALGWLNAFENRSAIQFHHRVLAVITVLTAVLLWVRWRNPLSRLRAGTALAGTAALACVQAGLGIGTLVLVVPLTLAALHQAVALALFMASLWLAFETHRPLARAADHG